MLPSIPFYPFSLLISFSLFFFPYSTHLVSLLTLPCTFLSLYTSLSNCNSWTLCFECLKFISNPTSSVHKHLLIFHGLCLIRSLFCGVYSPVSILRSLFSGLYSLCSILYLLFPCLYPSLPPYSKPLNSWAFLRLEASIISWRWRRFCRTTLGTVLICLRSACSPRIFFLSSKDNLLMLFIQSL